MSPVTIGQIIKNKENLYEGNLVEYFRVVFSKAQNLGNPYHNFRHVFHVVWLCDDACMFYKNQLTKNEMRCLLIAAMFHDFDHPGIMGDDDLNIARAIRALKKYILREDLEYFEIIASIISATEYPYKTATHILSLPKQIIRDADMGQAFSVAWMQQILFGLAEEWGRQPIDVLRAQTEFLKNLRFSTDWAKQMFPQWQIDAKLAEVEEFLQILE